MKKLSTGYLYLINTLILFSTYEAVSKTLVGKINSFQINFIRFFIGGIILLVFLAFKGNLKVGGKDFLYLTGIGIINVVFSMNLLQLALYVPGAKASVVAVIFSSNPIFVTIFSAFIEKEKLKINKVAGLVLGIVGICVIFLEKINFRAITYLSPLYAFLAAITYGLYTVLGRKVSVRIGSLKMNTYSFLMGSLVLLAGMLVLRVPVFKFDFSGVIQVAYLSVFVTGLAYLTYFIGLTITGASTGSLVFFMKPALASLIAVIFLGEHPSVNLLFGTLLIILGIMVVLYWSNIYSARE